MPEYVYDEAFEHRLERVLRDIGNEAVLPFDPYETTQIAITRSKIGLVPITQIPIEQARAAQSQHAQQAQQDQQAFSNQQTSPLAIPAPPVGPPLAPPPYVPPPGPPPGYYDEPLADDRPRRWPLLAAIGLLIAALVFAGFVTGFIKLPSNFGITVNSPAPTQTTSPTVTSAPGGEPTPKKTKKPRRTPKPRRTQAPATAEPQPTAPPTEPPTPEPAQATPEPAAT